MSFKQRFAIFMNQINIVVIYFLSFNTCYLLLLLLYNDVIFKKE